jgi:hypothetical protein
MPKPQRRTDRVTLSALLTSGLLTASEQRVFQGWYDDVMGGKRIELTPNERMWADSVYDKHKLGDARFANRKEARARVTKQENLLDKMPRPLKPPGRT